jgi:excisionase family DNA binding protein
MEAKTTHSLTEPHRIAFTIKEAAQASSISRSLLYIAIGRGALHARKLGGRTLILESDLQKFLRGLPCSSQFEATLEARKGRGRPRKSFVQERVA